MSDKLQHISREQKHSEDTLHNAAHSGNDSSPKTPNNSKGTIRLIMGIVAIVVSVVALLQSCTVTGLGAFVSEEAAAGGMVGILVALLMLIAGIIDIATRKTSGKAGSVASIIAYASATLLGFSFSSSFPDLGIYAGICLLFALINVVQLIRRKK